MSHNIPFNDISKYLENKDIKQKISSLENSVRNYRNQILENMNLVEKDY